MNEQSPLSEKELQEVEAVTKATIDNKEVGAKYEVGKVYTLPAGTVIMNALESENVTLKEPLTAKVTNVDYDYYVFKTTEWSVVVDTEEKGPQKISLFHVDRNFEVE